MEKQLTTFETIGAAVIYLVAAIIIAYVLFQIYKKIKRPVVVRKISIFPIFTIIYATLGLITGNLFESQGFWGGLWTLPFMILAVFLMMKFDPEFY